LLIHFILLSTDRFNWLEGPHKGAVAAQMAPMPAK
jgi:light-harvesting complex 1 alpha chain